MSASVPQSSPGASPALSVIALVPDRFETIARTVGHLAGQSIASEIELVIVTPASALAVPEPEVRAFGRWQVVAVNGWGSTSEARAAGIRAATSPIVALVEDHCYPTPGWAQALVDAHREDWAGVGPVVLNANPATLVSWANLLIEYGPWLAPLPRGAYAHIPGHNSSYKRDRLLEYGDRLPELLEAESVLQWDLGRRGHRFAIEPAARSRHENFALFRPSLQLRFHGGRLFAANRARTWGVARRLAFAAGAPLIPLLRTWRARRHARRLKDSRRRRGLLLVTFLLLVVDGLGEAAGYAAGGGRAMARLTDLEFHRHRFVHPRDRALTS